MLFPPSMNATFYTLALYFGNARAIDRGGSCSYTGRDMLEANGLLTLIVRNDSPSFYYYFSVGSSVYA